MSINEPCNHEDECENYCSKCGKPLKERCSKCGEMERIGRERCETGMGLLSSAEEARDTFMEERSEWLEIKSMFYFMFLYIPLHVLLFQHDIISADTMMASFLLGLFTTWPAGCILLHMLLKTKLKPYWDARFLEQFPQHARILKAENPSQQQKTA